jgi:endonuclease/exonuclease/phosphatase family metal-dependent hydrolase
MKSILLFLVICISLISPGFGQHKEIKIMTYNIWYANPGAGENIWENRREGVVQTILGNNIDIAGLQEVLLMQLKDLESRLWDYQWVGIGRDDGKEQGEFAPIFFKKQRFKMSQSGNFWLSETPDSVGSLGWDAACIRIATWVKLIDKISACELYVFNTHFDHVGEKARSESALLLSENILKIAGNNPVILTGDFNCQKGSEPYNLLLDPSKGIKLKDSRYSGKIKARGPDFSFIGSEFKGTSGDIIDHIFISDEIGLIDSEIIQNCTIGKCPSDHLPVTATIEIRTAHKQ